MSPEDRSRKCSAGPSVLENLGAVYQTAHSRDQISVLNKRKVLTKPKGDISPRCYAVWKMIDARSQ